MDKLLSLDKRLVRQAFAQSATGYDQAASLQKNVANELYEKYLTLSKAEKLLDIGCGTGFLTALLLQNPRCRQVIAIDIAQPMLVENRQKLADPRVSYCCADAEDLPLAASTFDQIVSNLALQWCPLLLPIFATFNSVLKPQGELVFSTFGPRTLSELKRAWATVDDYSHVNDFYDLATIHHFLQQTGFQVLDATNVVYKTPYPHVLDLLKELKQIGAHNVTAARNKTLTTRAKLEQMFNAYQNQCGNSIVASYEIFYIRAKKPC